MKFDFDKCPDCGYVNNNRPNICPSCGFNLLEYRTKLFLKKEKYIIEKRKIEQEKELEEKMEANYKKAIDLLLSNNNKEGLELLKELGNYKDSLEYKEKCELIVYDNFIFDFNSVDLLKTLYNDKVIELNNGVPDTSEIKKYEQFIYRYITRNTFYEPVDIKDLIDKYTFIEEYRDTSLYLSICRYAIKLIEKYKEVKQEENYKKGVECFNQEKYDEAIKIFENLKYEDSSSLYEKAKILKEKKDYYLKGLDSYNNKKYSEALNSLMRSRNYKDSEELIEKIGKITRKKFWIFIVSIAIIVVLLITTFIIIGVIQNENSRYFLGRYPQTLVKDETTINNLNNKAGKVPSSSNNGNWSLYDYVIDDTFEDYMYYQDIDYDNDGIYDYRGVYFIKYRPYYISYISTPSDSYQDDNGFVINTLYWFKYERIEWKVLKEENNKKLIVSNMVLDSQEFYYERTNFKIEHNGGIGYVNNYELSNIRKWLNNDFYNIAFNETEKNKIEKTIVDNSTNVMASNVYYVENNTIDNIFLLSYKDIKNYYNMLPKIKGTDYAKSQGLRVYDSDYSIWWLRTPTESNAIVDCGGEDYDTQEDVNSTNTGVRPACWVNL